MSKARILLVEDERITAMDERGLLTDAGYEVVGTAASGEEAIRMAETRHPDLVLMDIKLEGEMDGIQAAGIVRERLGIPVVFVSAHTDGELLDRAKVSEPFGYVVKPFTPEALQTNIEIALYKHRMEARLKEREQFLADITSELGEGLLVLDRNGRLVFINPEAERQLGWSREELALDDVHERIHNHRGLGVPAASCRVLKVLRTGKKERVDEDRFLHRDGHSFPVGYTAAPITRDGEVTGVVAVFQDITEKKRLSQRLYHLATHDPVTGLHNRSELERRIDEEVGRALRYKRPVSVFMIDLDHFKRVNDEHGHQAGDTVLRRFADLLRAETRKSDYVARYGGEEFIVILPETTLAMAVELAERLCGAIAARPFRLDDGVLISLSASLGVANLPAHGASDQALIAAADAAMYRAKEKGRNRVCVAVEQTAE
jgi:diguanylate cyclase (GGDEF)-like protein/PAS domain S-box-containing protein